MERVNVEREKVGESCFGPNAWPHEVICPEWASEAKVREWEPQHFVNNVVRRIPMWARGVLKISDPDALEETCQEFCLTMIKYRPDLAYAYQKASKRVYLARILMYTHWRTMRSRRPEGAGGHFNVDSVEGTPNDPSMGAEQRDLLDVARGWIPLLPESERLGANEAFGLKSCSDVSKRLRRVRVSRAEKRMRRLAIARGLHDRPHHSHRVRFSRTRRIRVPDSRLVAKETQQLACANDDSMSDSL